MAYHFALGYATHLFYFITKPTNKAVPRIRTEIEREHHFHRDDIVAFVVVVFVEEWIFLFLFPLNVPTVINSFFCVFAFLIHTSTHLVNEVASIESVFRKKTSFVYECVCDVFMNTHIPNETSLNRDRLTVSFELVVCTTIITIHRFAEHKILWLVQRSDTKFSRAIVLKQRRLSGGWWKFCRM